MNPVRIPLSIGSSVNLTADISPASPFPKQRYVLLPPPASAGVDYLVELEMLNDFNPSFSMWSHNSTRSSNYFGVSAALTSTSRWAHISGASFSLGETYSVALGCLSGNTCSYTVRVSVVPYIVLGNFAENESVPATQQVLRAGQRRVFKISNPTLTPATRAGSLYLNSSTSVTRYVANSPLPGSGGVTGGGILVLAPCHFGPTDGNGYLTVKMSLAEPDAQETISVRLLDLNGTEAHRSRSAQLTPRFFCRRFLCPYKLVRPTI